MGLSNYGDFSKNFDLVNHQVTDEFIDRLWEYLQKYPMLTENNALFLTVADPTMDDTVNKVVSLLNKKAGKDKYDTAAFMTSQGSSVKSIYNTDLSLSKLSKIAEEINNELYPNG